MDSSITALAAVLGLVLVVVGVGFAFLQLQAQSVAEGEKEAQTERRGGGRARASDDENGEDAVGGNRVARRGARGRMGAMGMRQRLQQQLAAQQAQAQAQGRNLNAMDASDGSVSDEEEEDEQGAGRLDRRQRKDKRRQERREAREAERQERQEQQQRKALPSSYEERMRKRDQEREEREREQEEEIRRAAEERQRREDEEAAKWMGMISVQDAGHDQAEEEGRGGGVLGQFVDYITTHKTVPLEQLAAEFRMRTTDVIDRIRSLEEAGRLTGVMDERGKYIYISLDEMRHVATWLVQRGRVSIPDLATKSSELIDLEPKAATSTALHGRGTLDFDTILAD